MRPYTDKDISNEKSVPGPQIILGTRELSLEEFVLIPGNEFSSPQKGIKTNSSSDSSLVSGTIWGPGTDFSLDISLSVYGLMELVHDLRVLILGTNQEP
jgi:hypothetical protein